MIRTYVSASGVFVESISHAEMGDGLGSCNFRESREKSGTTGGQREGWKPGGSGIVSFPFVSSGVLMWEEDSHGAALVLIDVFVIDIYSCDRPQLVS